ncbi:MAG: HlyD family efflux transporter periplasmic adaptor subunit [Tissierellia bacterium]|nr:HlyD family efflux transporter periplasmic adaptor subunit [Tissierellia bacterium]
MENKARKQKKFNKNKIKRLLKIVALVLIIVFIFGKFFPQSYKSNVKTTNPRRSEYIDKINSRAYLIMHEKVYTSQGEGVVDYNVREGERVPKDYEILSLNLMTDVSSIKNELLRIQSAIEYKNQSLNPKLSRYEMSEKEINIIKTIQDAMALGNRKEIFDAIENLEINTRKSINISEMGDLIDLSMTELEARRDNLSKQISTNNIAYKAENAGVISYKIDNVEDNLKYEKATDFTYDYLKKNTPENTQKASNTVKTGEKLYKIIDNFEYILAIIIEDANQIKEIKEGIDIEILVNNNTDIKGEVIAKNIDGEKGVIITKVTTSMDDLGYNRIAEVSIIKSRSRCLIIPTSSIVEVKNNLGVYIKELNGIVRFRPINVLRQNELETYVEIGDNKGYISIGNTKEKTLSMFDEVIDNPQNIEEGQIIR